MTEEQPPTPENERVFPDDYYQYDKEEALKTIRNLPEHIREAYKQATTITPERSFTKLVIAGMGGSGIAGALLKLVLDADPECTISVETAKGYEAPKSVDENTLLIAISYSGNTEETLSTYKTAIRKGCQAILISSGGKAEELAKINNHQHVKIPSGLQPRMAIAYLFFPLIRIMENAGIIKSKEKEVKALIEALRRQDITETAISLSGKLYEKIPLIWTDTSFYPVAYRWKTQINENAKTPAFSHELSELNHNEILSFTNTTTPFHVIILSTDKDHRRITKRITLLKDILQRQGVPVTEIALRGGLLNKVFSAIHLGDLTSYYLALRYETDPTPVTLIEQFKKDLGPFLI